MQAIGSRLRERFDFQADAEIAVEVDPRTLAPESLAALAEMGVRRASIGVQDFDPAVQRVVNRIQPTTSPPLAPTGCVASACGP